MICSSSPRNELGHLRSLEDIGAIPLGVPERDEEGTEHLYIIEIRSASGKTVYYKVGKSVDVRRRLQEIRTRCSDMVNWTICLKALFCGDGHFEEPLHAALRNIKGAMVKNFRGFDSHQGREGENSKEVYKLTYPTILGTMICML